MTWSITADGKTAGPYPADELPPDNPTVEVVSKNIHRGKGGSWDVSIGVVVTSGGERVELGRYRLVPID